MPSVLHVMDRTGDTRHEWSRSNPAEVEIARKAFEIAREKKMLIYKSKADGTKGEILRQFDPTAERIICVPQTVGG